MKDKLVRIDGFLFNKDLITMVERITEHRSDIHMLSGKKQRVRVNKDSLFVILNYSDSDYAIRFQDEQEIPDYA